MGLFSKKKSTAEFIAKLDAEDFTVFKDVCIDEKRIDYVIVSIYGIFVIRNTGFQGDILGSASAPKIEHLYAGVQTEEENPLIPIHTAKSAIMKALDVSEKVVYDFAIISDKAVVRNIPASLFITETEFQKFIKSFKKEYFMPNLKKRFVETFAENFVA